MSEPVNMLLDALNMSAKAGNASIAEGDTLKRILAEMGVLNTSANAATDVKTSTTNVVEGQALSAAQAAQDKTIAFANNRNANGSTPEEILVQLGIRMSEQMQAAQVSEDTISSKESINMVQDPLGWLNAQLTLQHDYQRYNDAATKAANASNNIATLTTSIDEYGQTQQALKKTITDASIAATAQARIAEGEAIKVAATRGHLKDEMVIASAIQNTAADQAAEAARQLGMMNTERQFAMEQERMNMAREQFNWAKEAKALATKDKASADQAKAEMLQRYNIGAEALGLPPETNFDALMLRMELGGTDKTRISAAFEASGNSLAAGSTRVASTPGGATSMIVQGVYPRGNDAGFSRMKTYLKDTWSNASAANVGAKDQQGLTVAGVNARVKADTERFTKNAVAPGSFYQPPPIAAITDTLAVRNTALHAKVLATAGKDLTSAAPTPIIKLAYEAVKAGTLSYEDAATGIVTFYKQAVTINNATQRYAQVGIQPQHSFNVKPDIYGSDIPANLVDHASVLRLFAVMKSREVFKNIQGGGLNLPAAL